jgi:hypothetical protein
MEEMLETPGAVFSEQFFLTIICLIKLPVETEANHTLLYLIDNLVLSILQKLFPSFDAVGDIRTY